MMITFKRFDPLKIGSASEQPFTGDLTAHREVLTP